MLDFDIENELRPNLGSDEKLLWTGRPKKGIVFRSSDIIAVPFSLLWCGFAIFWETMALRSAGPSFFALFGVPFVGIGVYMVVGRFFADARNRANTVYGITKDRIIIKSGVFSSNIKSLNIRGISDISFTQKADNTGTIFLGPSPAFAIYGTGRLGGRQTLLPPMLDMIDDVHSVYEKIIELQRQA